MPNLSRRITIAAALLLVAAPAAALRAQSAGNADTALPFHAGQWGLNANIGQSFGIGALRFSAPNRALVLEASANVQRATQVSPNPFNPFSPNTQHVTSGAVSLDLGLRGYRPLSGAAALFHTVGVGGNYSGGSGIHGWGASVFGNLGAQYMFESHFSLGVTAGLRAGYSQDRQNLGGTLVRVNRYYVGTDQTRAMATVYF